MEMKPFKKNEFNCMTVEKKNPTSEKYVKRNQQKVNFIYAMTRIKHTLLLSSQLIAHASSWYA